MKKNYYLSGEFNLTCDRCSKKIKAHQAKHEWTGFIVCGDCYETRHPQDFVKAKTDKLTVPFQRPIPELAFLHLLPIFDSVTVTDSSTIQFTVDYNRDITDTLLANDSLLFDVTRILSDSQMVGEVARRSISYWSARASRNIVSHSKVRKGSPSGVILTYNVKCNSSRSEDRQTRRGAALCPGQS